MSESTEAAAVIDLTEARHERRHQLHEARLEQVRNAFAKAFPLDPAAPAKKRRAKKKPKKR